MYIVLLLLEHVLPHEMHGLLVVHLVEYPVAPDYDKVLLDTGLAHPERRDVRLRDHHLRVTLEFDQLGLDVSESARDRESPWEDTVRPVDDLLLTFVCGVRVRYHRRVLVDSPPVLLDALHLDVVRGLVVVREDDHVLPEVGGHERAGVSHVRDVADVVDDDDHNRAGTRTVKLTDVFNLLLSELEEKLLGLTEAVTDGFQRMLWEVVIFDDLKYQN